MSPWPKYGNVNLGGVTSRICLNSRNLVFLEANLYLKA